jgi:glutamate carboxypeptidase
MDKFLRATTPPAAGLQSKLEAKRVLRYFEKQCDEIVQSIKQLIEIESPSDVKQAVDRLGAVLAGRFGDLGGKVRVHPADKFGNHLQIDFPGRSGGKPVLLLGHMDTVYPVGTISSMPCRIDRGRIWGPGALDMKSGIALILHAVAALRSWHGDQLPRALTILLVSDEEVGSDSSQPIT